MMKSFALFLLAFASVSFLQVAQIEAEGSEKYLYVLYYEDEGCETVPVTAIGFVGEDDDTLFGGAGTSGLCAEEGVCLVDRFSSQCLALERTVDGTMTFSIGDDGLIYQCDDTNVDGECSFLDQCYGSSAYPSCNFIVITSSKLAADTSIIQNPNPTGLEEQAYWHFYSDDACEHWEGSQGVLNGETQIFGTDETITCRDSMACVFNPQGEGCLQHDLELTNATVYSGTENGGQDATECNEDFSNCVVQDPSECRKSTLYQSCYYKWSSATQFLSEPGKFITNYETTDTQSEIDLDESTDIIEADAPAPESTPDAGPATSNGPSDAAVGRRSGSYPLSFSVIIMLFAYF